MPSAVSDILQDHLGYSVVAAQSINSQIYAHSCANNYIVLGDIGNTNGKADGKAIVFEMRAS